MINLIRYIYSDNLSAIDNMILDSYLTYKFDINFIRIYKWRKPTISLGIKNKVTDLNIEYIRSKKIDVVRRPTGGGIIYHCDDCCFSIITNTNYSPRENYFYIKKMIEKIFLNLGLKVTKTEDKNIKSPICFDSTNSHEISINNRKVVGIAQRKIFGRYLVQGSIQLRTVKLKFILNSHDDIIQYGLDTITFNEIRDCLYNMFAQNALIQKYDVDDIIGHQDFQRYKQKHLKNFYEEL